MLVALCLLTFGAAQIAGQGPGHAFDKEANFSHYKTYHILGDGIRWGRFAGDAALGHSLFDADFVRTNFGNNFILGDSSQGSFRVQAGVQFRF